jgi:uncharacterized repeat protein (TIGR02543 family)
MKKLTRSFAPAAVIAAAVVVMLAGCAELFHGEPAMYRVDFYNNNSLWESKKVEAGLELGSLPETPSMSGYTFTGWYTGSNGSGTEFTSSTIIKESVRLYAAWSGGGDPNNLPPSTPTGVTAAALSSSSIQVSWNGASGATGYRVYRSNSPSGSYSMVEAGTSSAYYTDTGLSPNTTYYYKVSAYNSAGESAQSSSASATTLSGQGGSAPSTPTGVTATALSSSSIQLSWNPVSGATGYIISYTDDFGMHQSEETTGTSYTHTGLSPNTTYLYAIYAYNSAGESTPATVSATTDPAGPGPGATSDTAIVLTSSDSAWTSGELNAASPEMWYTFSVPNNNVTYYLLGRDMYANNDYYTYTSDVSFEIYDTGLNLVTTIDAGNGGVSWRPEGAPGYNYIETTNAAGKWYVKVVPYLGNSAYYGTYAIYFYYGYGYVN